ncbi:MAG: cyclic-phosphate processing receiver domain-containing protein [Cellulomonas sp.]
MKIALYSDLHLEFMRDKPWQPPVSALKADVIILAGDIGYGTMGLEWARNLLSRTDAHIIFVAGNHEFYGYYMDAKMQAIRDFCGAPNGWTGDSENHRLHFLENDAVEINGVRFLGAMMWSDFRLYGEDEHQANSMQKAKSGINDYHKIRGQDGNPLDPRETVRLHNETAAFIDAELAKPFDGKTVVVTHFAPHRGAIAPEHLGNKLTPYFVADMSWLMEKHSIDLWVYGHTHNSTDFVAENGCRVVSNQRGSVHDLAWGDNGFREDLVIDLNHSNPVTHIEKKLKRSELLEVQARDKTGYIHLDDVPQPYRDEFWKWLFHKTRPYNPAEPGEKCAYVCDWKRWLNEVSAMTYRMFIDDLREPPDDWIIARTSVDALEYMQVHGCPLEISFDHDLGGDDTAMQVVKKIVEQDLDAGGEFIPATFKFVVHSANPIGARNIEGYLNGYLATRPGEKVFVACFEYIVKAVDCRFDVRNSILATLVTDCLDHNNTLSNPIREKYRKCVQDGVFDFIESCARNFHRTSPEN